MTSGAALAVIALLVGLYAGARWARAIRAIADVRTAKANVTKALNARRNAFWGLALAIAVTVVLIVLYLVNMASLMLPEDTSQL